MTTLAEYIIVAGAKNHPTMLEKSMYDSWANRIRLFIKEKKHAKSLYTTNYDQLYASLNQHERHANEVCISHERYPDSLAFITNSPTLYNPSQSPQHSDSGLAVPMFQQREDPIECINKVMAFLSVVASRKQRNCYYLKGNVAAGPPRGVKCYNFQGECHMEAGQILDEEQLAFLADPVKAVLMVNLSSCDPEVLSKVPYFDSYLNDMITQDVQEMRYSKQTHVDDFEDNKIHSGSNIIPYS
nr:hypothetical protein [Tanacetum cinerariifolium]